MKDYSQFGEQAAILDYVNKRWQTPGGVPPAPGLRFLDVGAWDPFTFSNTRALYEFGWSGVVIEPEPYKLIAQVREYGKSDRVQVVAAAVSLEGVPLRFELTEDSTSTSDAGIRDKWGAVVTYYGCATYVPITWAQINNWFGGFQFVNIDTEGTSVDLFKAMVDSGQVPECCCVEHDGRTTELLEVATKRGYKALLVNGTNVVLGQ